MKAQGIANPQHLTKRLYSITEAAHYLGRSVWSIRELLWKGSIPYVKYGKRIHLDIKDLNLFIEKNKVQSLI